jgi:hypothetical protein
MGGHRGGYRRRHGPWTPRRPPRPRDARDGRVPCGHHPLGVLETSQARRAALCLRGHGADRGDGLRPSPGHARAVAASTSLPVNTGVGVTQGAAALGHRLALPSEALGLVARGGPVLGTLCQARRRVRGTPGTTLGTRAVGVGAGLRHPRARLCGWRHGRGGRSLVDGQRGCDRWPQCMVPREEVGRVMGPKMLVHLRQASRGVITGRWHALAMQAGQGVCHQGRPGGVSAGQGRVLSPHGVAHRLSPYAAAPPGTRCIVRDGAVCGGPLAPSAGPLLLAGGPDGLLHTPGDLGRPPLRGADTSLAARHRHDQTPQAHPPGPPCGRDSGERDNQPRQAGETRHTANKRDDHGALIAALVGGAPGLQGAARAGKPLGRLTLGEALGWPTVIPLTQRRACDTIPALGASLVAVRRLVHSWAHRALLCSPSAFVYVMAKDGEVAVALQPFGVSRDSLAEVVFETKWPTR